MVPIRIKLKLTVPANAARTALYVFLVATCLFYPPFAVQADDVHAPSVTITHGQRQYYITKQFTSANGAWLACETGYHFASLWEIYDLSNLRYNTTLGITNADSAAGPPTATSFLQGSLPVRGWIRTGYGSYTSNIPGRANCGNWIHTSESYYGSTARLPSDWVNQQKDIGVWDVETQTCNNGITRVWCIENSLLHYVLLPVVLK